MTHSEAASDPNHTRCLTKSSKPAVNFLHFDPVAAAGGANGLYSPDKAIGRKTQIPSRR